MPTRYRQRSQAAARIIQRAAINFLRKKGSRRAGRARPRPSTRRATKPLTRGDVLKIIKSKQDPKVYKQPINSNTFTTSTSDSTTLCRHLTFTAGANDYAGTSFVCTQIQMPGTHGNLFYDTATEYGDNRPLLPVNGNPDASTIILNRITARIDYTSHTGIDHILCWYLYNLKHTLATATFIANVQSNKVVVPYKSYLTSHQQRNEQDVRAIDADYKLLSSGKMIIKRATPYNDSPTIRTLKVSNTFGKKGKKIEFASNTDQIGSCGAFILVTSITGKNGNLVPNNNTGLIQHGMVNTYWNKVLSNT